MWVSATTRLNAVAFKLHIPSLLLTSYCCVPAPHFPAIIGLTISLTISFHQFTCSQRLVSVSGALFLFSSEGFAYKGTYTVFG